MLGTLIIISLNRTVLCNCCCVALRTFCLQ